MDRFLLWDKCSPSVVAAAYHSRIRNTNNTGRSDNTTCFRSCTGVQQGDPIGPFLFALAIHPIVLKLRSRIRNAYNRHDLLQHPAFMGFYLDDGMIVAHQTALADALRLLETREVV